MLLIKSNINYDKIKTTLKLKLTNFLINIRDEKLLNL